MEAGWVRTRDLQLSMQVELTTAPRPPPMIEDSCGWGFSHVGQHNQIMMLSREFLLLHGMIQINLFMFLVYIFVYVFLTERQKTFILPKLLGDPR